MKFKNTLISITRGLFVFSALGGLAYGARAAVYNLYFNNNEQGDNSTSTPSVVVKDGKDKDEDETDSNTEETNKPEEEKKAEEAKPAPQEPAVAPTTTQPAKATAVADYTWRLGISAGGFSNREAGYMNEYSNGSTGDYSYEVNSGSGGYLGVSLGYFPVQRFGLNVYAQLGIPEKSSYSYSSYSGYSTRRETRHAFGAELEFNPLRFKSGQGSETLEFGLTVGASSLMHDEAGGIDLMHIGFRGAYNFSSGWGLAGILRVSPKYQSLDLGVNFLF